MKYYIYFVTLFCLKLPVKLQLSENTNLIDTLNNKIHELRLRQLKEIITPDFRSKFISFYENNYHWKFASGISLFDKNFMMIDNEFHSFLDLEKLNITQVATIIEGHDRIWIAELVEFDNHAIMMLVLNKKEVRIIKFIKGTDQQFNFQEIQELEHSRISDAQMIRIGNKLYMIVATEEGSNIAVVRFYEFAGGNFYEKHVLHTQGVSQIKIFEDSSAMILMLNQRRGAFTICDIYTYEDEELRKVQILKLERPQHIIPYKINEENFVFVLSAWKRHLYSWTGSKLMEVSTESTNNNEYQRITLSKINGSSILFASLYNKVDIFILSTRGAVFLTSQEYLHNYSALLSLVHSKIKGTDYLFVTGNVGIQGEIECYEIELTAKPKPEQTTPVIDPLAICLNSLKEHLETQNVNFLIKPGNSALRSRGSSSFMASYRLRSDDNTKDFEEKIKDIEDRTSSISQTASTFKLNEEELEINGEVVVEGVIKGKELLTGNIQIETMNNKRWLPDQWLSYSKNQTIAGGKDANNLRVKELTTSTEIDLLEDLLLNNSDVSISGSFTIENLITKDLSSDEINNIRMEDVFMRGRDAIIRGMKTISNLTVSNIEANRIQSVHSSAENDLNEPMGTNRFGPHVIIDDLEVEYIDGVNWKSFESSVFRYGITKEIQGNIRMRTFDAKNLYVSSLNKVDVSNFMTRTTDQTISSSIEIEQIDLKSNMIVNLMNGINPSVSIATVNNPTVKGTVSIEKLRIIGNLILSYTNASNEDQHIVGTNESDFMQIYHKDIRINGNLRLKNFRNLDSLIISFGEDQEEFNPNDLNKYWMKNVNQVIPVHVKAKGGVRTPHLQTKVLNGNSVSDFLLNDTVNTLPANFAFENVTFLGNVHLNDKKSHKPDLERINTESVKLNGSFVIEGKKVFKNTLKINNLIADELNGVEKRNLATKNDQLIFTGQKMFENLVINGNLESKIFSFEELNSVNIESLKNSAIYIDRPINIENQSFSHISTDKLNVETLNGIPINEYLTDAKDMLDISVIDSLIINGKLAIGNMLGLSKINDKHPDVLFTNRLRQDDEGVLHGNVRFLEDVTIDNLSATFINNINFRNLINKIFFKGGNQTIQTEYTFKTIKTKNLLTPKINDIQIDPLVDIKSKDVQNIIAYKGVEFKESSLTRLVAENILPCDIAAALKVMKNPPTQTWSRITVHGDVTLLDVENPLHDIFENAVLLNGKNIIQAPVHFKNIFANNVDTNEYINGINLTHIISDALLKKSETDQVVSGLNVIERLGVYSATVNNDSDITVVNGVEFPDIYNRVIPKGAIGIMPITGRKTFYAGLQTDRIQSETVSNVVPEQLVTLADTRNITSATFENVEVKSLTVDRINNQDFHKFMNDRVLLVGPQIQELEGLYSFHDVHVDGNLEVPAINNVDIHDIVVDNRNQEIPSKKIFENDLLVHGNINIEMLNGHFISDIYEKAFLRNEKSYINQNVKIMKPSVVNGTIITESINGYPVQKMKRVLDVETYHIQEEEVNKMVQTIEKSARKNFKLTQKMPSDIMYLEKSNVIQLPLKNAVDARVFRLKDYLLIHVIEEEEGTVCGMPKGCKCPVQHTIQISPENSINHFFSKGSQRVYSYDDSMMTVHLMTNSVSTDATCRRNSTKTEQSTLSWSTVSHPTSAGSMFSKTLNFTGYVSAVEFFTVNGSTYVIIGEYYDPTTNSYDLDCVVYKFNQDRTAITQVQRIHTYGVWNLKIFYTPQGINLIIGMVGDGLPTHNLEKTLFMRFSESEELFKLLRTVEAYGCSSAVGILLESESFIVLAHKINPVLIFKYDPRQDNYIFYQNLWDQTPISGISLFYSGYYGRSDPYLCVTSKKGVYSIYTYEYIQGWQRKFFNEIKGLRNLVPFELNDELYLFALSSNISSVLTVVKYGSD